MKSLRPLVARAALAAFTLVAASSALAQGTVLRVVPHSNLAILDLAHQPDEYVVIDDMVASAKVMALSALELLGARPA